MLCHAHAKGVLVVVKHNFDAVDQLCDLNARQEWIEVRWRREATVVFCHGSADSHLLICRPPTSSSPPTTPTASTLTRRSP